MAKKAYSASSILAQFDGEKTKKLFSIPLMGATAGELLDSLKDPKQAEQFGAQLGEWLSQMKSNISFPTLNLNIDAADVRLSAWRDDLRWAVIIETLVYNMRSGGHNGIQDWLYCFGNCLLPRSDGENWNVHILNVTQDGPDGPTFCDGQHRNVRPEAKSIRIREDVVPIDLRPHVLRATGIEPGPDADGVEHYGGTILLRSLLAHHRDKLLATEHELRKLIPQDLTLFLRLDEWHHPDTSAGQRPGKAEAFRLLAKAIAAGDPAKYRPTERANTHWSNWKQVIV